MKTQLSLLMLNLKSSFYVISSILLAFFAPIVGLVLTVGLVILADTLFGMYRAHKLKETITSRKLSRVVSKLVLYESSILLIYCVDVFLVGEMISVLTSIPNFLTKLVAVGLVGIEVKSIDESLKMLNIDVWKSLKGILARTKDIKTDINNITNNKEA
jgi:fumarate reductase subunit D